ncbi:acyltransferase family protein [Frateuria terrea]|uniref:Peptidoglycan/LPS O-acetylase OafA/YrhL, contains acyltransferase and SGNH-hydrolase domains n=1 Tax=Frateuria terrea TaxID=529704 RepID=A0A1H6ZEF3_9GAMM|nr:acyltransferase family protein [Frateuria terrea]SEJ50504.1 Peptidoglycan/LPS O-acetylase OafA/YrhL, contains acyltransferase and SGNH-hydrolase domains [Frateuria terrea]SFP78857.1 Peptidoglycan/LPS O-acetylase OafA/YrhL, contains acyltransferase and SGNH-hydrolase domains [Frateuria terrea]
MEALKGYRCDIDGIRALAVLAVIAYHFGFGTSGGYVGVDVFFVISGFLIGSLIYEDAQAGRFSYLKFYTRRARRILPALLVVLAVSYLVMLVMATPTEMRNFSATAVASVFSVSNIELWRSMGYFRPNAQLNPLLMTWSLGVEEQFYLLVPVVLLFLRRWPLRWRLWSLAGLLVASFVLACVGMLFTPAGVFYMLPTRAWELGAGVLLGVVAIHRNQRPGESGSGSGSGWGAEARAAAGLLLILVPTLTYRSDTPVPYMAVPVLGTVLLLGSSTSFINRCLLSLPAVRFVGLISYSLYLWHWPVISMTNMVSVHEPSLALRLVLLVGVFCLSWLSYRYVEQTFRRSRTSPRVSLLRYAGAMAVLAVCATSALATGGLPQRWSRSFLVETAKNPNDPCLPMGSHPKLVEPCYPKTDGPVLALVGDSHAAALGPGLRVLAAKAGMRVMQMTKSACPFLVGVSRVTYSKPSHFTACALFDQRVLKLVENDPRVDTVVIAGAWWTGTLDGSYTATRGPSGSPYELFERGLLAAVRAFQQKGKRVVIVRDVPYMDFLPLKRMAACSSRLRAWINGRHDANGCAYANTTELVDDAPDLAILQKVAAQTGVELIDPHKALCSGKHCSIVLNGHALYRDEQHLTVTGSKLVSSAFSDAVGQPDSATAAAAP